MGNESRDGHSKGSCMRFYCESHDNKERCNDCRLVPIAGVMVQSEYKKAVQNCMNCGKRVNGNECVVKKVFSQSFKNAGGKYKRSIYIIKSDENECAYYEKAVK